MKRKWSLVLGLAVDDLKLLPLDRITGMNLVSTGIGDRELEYLSQFKQVSQLSVVSNHNITNDGLKYLAEMPHLFHLQIQTNPQLGDEGFRHLSKLKSLGHLEWDSPLVDEGFASITKMTALQNLKMRSTGDALSLEPLKDLANFDLLEISWRHEPNLEGLAGHKTLRRLRAMDSRISDDDLLWLKDNTALENLSLEGAGITDAGLKHLYGLVNLTELNLTNAKNVTAKGVAAFRKALPECKVIRGGESHDNLTDFERNRLVAERIIQIGGRLNIHDDGEDGGNWYEVSSLDKLPKNDFHFNTIDCIGNAKLTDDVLEELHRLHPSLKTNFLEFGGTAITSNGLVHLAGWSVEFFDSGNTAIGGEGLQHLQDIEGLHFVGLHSVPLTVADLKLLPLDRITGMNLSNTGFGDEELKYLSQFKQINQLALDNNHNITNDGLKYLAAMPNLVRLNFAGNPQLGDEGFRHLSKLKALEFLYWRSPLTDEGFAHITEMTALRQLEIEVTREVLSLEPLKMLPNLDELTILRYPKPNLEGLAGHNTLRRLRMIDPRISDDDLLWLKDNTALENLSLDCANARITDAGLKHLHGLVNLRSLDLTGIENITANGVAAFRKALPECEVIWDGESHDNLTDFERNRLVAERIIEIGGKVQISDDGEYLGNYHVVSSLDKLPENDFHFHTIDCFKNKNLTDEVLEELHRLHPSLETRDLRLGSTSATSKGLVHLVGWTILDLDLQGNMAVAGNGLQHLREVNGLRQLILSGVALTLDDLKLLPLDRITGLHLSSTDIGDEELKYLSQFKQILNLNAAGTNVTAEGVAAFRKALPKCKVIWDGENGN